MSRRSPSVAVIGGGPAGLMAAEVLLAGGVNVDLYDAMPSVGRKFLLAGKGGLNLTHSDPLPQFLKRYGVRRQQIAPMLEKFGPKELRDWAHGLGVETFVGSSGRVFPKEMKAAPLLRAWVQRLRAAGLRLHARHRWIGWTEDGSLRMISPDGVRSVQADAVVLALGGGSWARLGSDGAWLPILRERGIEVAPLQPTNCGFNAEWSEHLRSRFAGQAVKPVVLSFTDASGVIHRRPGEFVITEHGVEGSLIYALSAPLRDTISAKGHATIHLDLAPGRELERVHSDLSHPRGSRSMASHLQSRMNLHGAKTALLREAVPKEAFADPIRLAAAIKSLPLRLISPRPLDEAISSAGGVTFEALDDKLMLRSLPGTFCAGEMLDWEAPTGGYLLTTCFASGYFAGQGVLDWLKVNKKPT